MNIRPHLISRSSVRRLTGVAAAVVLVAAAASTSSATGGGHRPPADSLRVLGDRVDLAIGVAINPAGIDRPDYAKIAREQFSSITPENEMKWETVEPTRGTYNWAPAERLMAFAKANRQSVRGHTLVWHNQNPTWLTQGVADGTISDTELRALLRKHIIDEVTHFKGRVWQWDVANEFFANAWDPNPLPSGVNGDNFWVQHLGEGIIADMFRWAHRADPKALLFYNDFNIAGQDGTNAKADAVYAFVKKLLRDRVPIHGVGEQGHLDTQYGFSGELFQADLQRYADLGVKVAVTEADVRTFVNNAEEQVPTNPLAQFAQPFEFSQMLQACLAIRDCLSFTVWGVDDADSWVPGVFAGEGAATLYDVNLQPKPAYTALQQDLKLAPGVPRHR
jgi:endo-1,4-beta-xylanase